MEITVTLNTDDIKDAITKYLENNDIQVEELVSYTDFPMMLVSEGNRFSFRDEGQSYEDMNSSVAIMKYQDYFDITKDVVELASNEVLVYSNVNDINNSIILFDESAISKVLSCSFTDLMTLHSEEPQFFSDSLSDVFLSLPSPIP